MAQSMQGSQPVYNQYSQPNNSQYYQQNASKQQYESGSANHGYNYLTNGQAPPPQQNYYISPQSSSTETLTNGASYNPTNYPYSNQTLNHQAIPTPLSGGPPPPTQFRKGAGDASSESEDQARAQAQAQAQGAPGAQNGEQQHLYNYSPNYSTDGSASTSGSPFGMNNSSSSSYEQLQQEYSNYYYQQQPSSNAQEQQNLSASMDAMCLDPQSGQATQVQAQYQGNSQGGPNQGYMANQEQPGYGYPPPPHMPHPQQIQAKPGPPPPSSYGAPRYPMAPSAKLGPQGGQPAPPPPPGATMGSFQPMNRQQGQPPGQPQPQQQPAYNNPNQYVAKPGQSGMANQNQNPNPNQNQSPTAPPARAQPQRRLDPDQMPSVLAVQDQDRELRQGEYKTGTKGDVPPLVTTDFVTQDLGTASPRYIRSTMYTVPCTADIQKMIAVPLALAITPFAKPAEKEHPLPLSDSGTLGPVRCSRCRAYMSPFMQFQDGGRRFHCPLCNANTDVPDEYFSHLDHTGHRVDRLQRPELCLGGYEITATNEYCKDNKLPKPPAFIFLLEVSYLSVRSGLVSLFCRRLKDVLAALPHDSNEEASEGGWSNVRVGFATYNNTVHFYNLKAGLTQPQMLTVADVDEVFVPLVDGFLVRIAEAEPLIDKMLSQIESQFASCQAADVVLGPAVQAGLEALKAAGCPGKLFVLHSSLPNAEAPGRLRNREDRKLIGTEKEKQMMQPNCDVYTLLGKECAAAGCSLDLFLFSNTYVDVATISEVTRLSGGSIYRFPFFQAEVDGERAIEQLRVVVARPIAFDAVMRVRCSSGVRAVDFLGHFHSSNANDLELAAIDSSKTIIADIKYDDKVSDVDGVQIQVALLYTSITGQRRVRVLNMLLNASSQYPDLFRSVENDTFINVLSKMAIRQMYTKGVREVAEQYTAALASSLACYRKHCAQPSSPGQLILPEAMKVTPVFLCSVLKSPPLRPSKPTYDPSLLNTEVPEMALDERSHAIQQLMSMSVSQTCAYYYPRLLPLHNVETGSNKLPTSIRCYYDRCESNGAYLLDNGVLLALWVGSACDPRWIQAVFGVPDFQHIPSDYKGELPELGNLLSERIRLIIRTVREERENFMKLVVVKQLDRLDASWFQYYLAEDQPPNSSTGGSRDEGGGAGLNALSYIDYLCHLHKEIRNILN